MEKVDKLIFADDVFDCIGDGKRTTIRNGHRNVEIGDITLESLDGRSMEAYSYMVIHTIAKYVPQDCYENDGFVDIDDMVEGMGRFYEGFSEDSIVTVIMFMTNEDEF